MRITVLARKRLLALLAFELVALVAVGMLPMQLSQPASSGPSNLTVYGYVKDSAGTALQGASISVTVVQTSAVQATTTDATGFYLVEFDLADWNVNDDVHVVCTFNSVQEENWTVATDLTVAQCDINYTFEIPEFGGFAGSLVAIAAIAALALVFIWKRVR